LEDVSSCSCLLWLAEQFSLTRTWVQVSLQRVVGLQPSSSFPLERLWQLEARAAVAFQSQLESQQQERLQLLLFPSFFQQPELHLVQPQRQPWHAHAVLAEAVEAVVEEPAASNTSKFLYANAACHPATA
jgi:hypothetical protein